MRAVLVWWLLGSMRMLLQLYARARSSMYRGGTFMFTYCSSYVWVHYYVLVFEPYCNEDVLWLDEINCMCLHKLASNRTLCN